MKTFYFLLAFMPGLAFSQSKQMINKVKNSVYYEYQISEPTKQNIKNSAKRLECFKKEGNFYKNYSEFLSKKEFLNQYKTIDTSEVEYKSFNYSFFVSSSYEYRMRFLKSSKCIKKNEADW